MHDLPLRRSRSALFALTWTAVHPIDATSPLAGMDARVLAEADAGLVVSLTGFDETLAATVHARHDYRAGEILWGARFADVLGRTPDGRRLIDYRSFHDTLPMSAPPPSEDAR
jgi:inward rectifier potassium channel